MKLKFVIGMMFVGLLLTLANSSAGAQEVVIGEAPKLPSEVANVCNVSDLELEALIERSRQGEILLNFVCEEKESLVEPQIPSETVVVCLVGGQGSATLDDLIDRASAGEFLLSFTCTGVAEVDLMHLGAQDIDNSLLWELGSVEAIPVPDANGNWSYTGYFRGEQKTTATLVICDRGQGTESIAKYKADALPNGYKVWPTCQLNYTQLQLVAFGGWVGNPNQYLWQMMSEDWPVPNEDGEFSYVGWLEPITYNLPVIISS